MARIIAICGKICSGKSWYARELREKSGGVIFSTDEVTYDLIDNEQGEFYDQLCPRVNAYLRKKAAEVALAGVDVILDWGFWLRAQRRELTEYFTGRGIPVEWHYVRVTDSRWDENIRIRNARVKAGEGGSDFFVTPELKAKVESLWEEPTPDEPDVIRDLS